jgi:hypothetical protein
MSGPRIMRVKSRLGGLALGHGGLTAGEAIGRADKAIDADREALQVTVDAVLGELAARFGAASPDGSRGDYEGLYQLASQIIDVAICLQGSQIEEAAHALCCLADRSQTLRVWDRQAIEVHIMVLRLLRSGGKAMPAVRRRRLIDGLRKVTAKRLGVDRPRSA